MIRDLVMTARSNLACWLDALAHRIDVPSSYWWRKR